MLADLDHLPHDHIVLVGSKHDFVGVQIHLMEGISHGRVGGDHVQFRGMFFAQIGRLAHVYVIQIQRLSHLVRSLARTFGRTFSFSLAFLRALPFRSFRRGHDLPRDNVQVFRQSLVGEINIENFAGGIDGDFDLVFVQGGHLAHDEHGEISTEFDFDPGTRQQARLPGVSALVGPRKQFHDLDAFVAEM